MKKYAILFTLLVSSVTLTGISFIDDAIWEIIFLVIGMIAYAIVGGLISLGIVRGKQMSKDAYSFIIILFILGGYGFYKLLEMIKDRILSWPLYVKIIVPSTIAAFIIGIIIVLFIKNRKKRLEDTK